TGIRPGHLIGCDVRYFIRIEGFIYQGVGVRGAADTEFGPHPNPHTQPAGHLIYWWLLMVECQSSSMNAPKCYGCHKAIKERYLLKALDHLWHEDCLKCVCCDRRLGSTFFTKADLILCKRDYFRMFGATGLCSACNKHIPGFEMVMRARRNVYHLECFKCKACSHTFCVGDRFYLYDNKILCEYDYAERMVFTNLN
ncbi:unnamed protein product, partial [Medioppia subpectinata]